MLRGGAVPERQRTCQRHDRTAEPTGVQIGHLLEQRLPVGLERALPIGQSPSPDSQEVVRLAEGLLTRCLQQFLLPRCLPGFLIHLIVYNNNNTVII